MGGPGSGGRRKPIAFHKARGTYRKDRHGEDIEPVRDGLDLTPPAFLSPAAKKEWVAMAGPLHQQGLLTELDFDCLALLCESTADWRQAVTQVAKHGPHSLWRKVERTAFEQMRRLHKTFGMTPHARQHHLPPSSGTDVTTTHARFFGGTRNSTKNVDFPTDG